jgi:hypothetical protein
MNIIILMQNIDKLLSYLGRRRKNGQESRLLLLGKMKHLPENERVSFAEKDRIY